MRWDKIAEARTFVLALLGFAAIAFGAFLLHDAAGFIVSGVELVLLAYLTDAPVKQDTR